MRKDLTPAQNNLIYIMLEVMDNEWGKNPDDADYLSRIETEYNFLTKVMADGYYLSSTRDRLNSFREYYWDEIVGMYRENYRKKKNLFKIPK